MVKTIGVFPMVLSLSLVLIQGILNPSNAEVKSDGTAQTQVQVANQSYLIEGGTQSGENLLHSFDQFSVESGWTANFELPMGTNLTNVISRVTGAGVSNLDGTLKINGSVQPVSLFLINPNGIVFGPNARLDLQGSFVASTAQSLQFSEGYLFSAKNPVPISSDLTIGVPIGLQFGLNPAPISGTFFDLSSSLEVKNGQTLAFVGGPLMLSGAGETSQNRLPIGFSAPGGQVILGSVGDNAIVKLSAPSSSLSWSMDFTATNRFQDIQLLNGFSITGGDFKRIDLHGRQILLSQGVQIGEPAVLDTQNKGIIFIFAAEELKLSNSSINSQTIGPANGGDIFIQSPRLILKDDSTVSVSSDNPFGFSEVGSAGNITLLSQDVRLESGSSILANSASSIAAGNIQITTQNLSLDRSTSITSESQAGQGGNLDITVQNALVLRNGSEISTSSTTTGNGGNIRISTGILGAVPQEDSNIITTALSGNGGKINISTQGLFGIYPNNNGNLRNSSDITAKSESGVDGAIDTNILTNNAVVSFTQPPIQLNQKLVRLSCFSNQPGKGDRFVTSGQGGLPNNPAQIANPVTVWQDLRPLDDHPLNPAKISLNSTVDPAKNPSPFPLIEAQGWIFAPDGSVSLVSEPTKQSSEVLADRQPCLVPTS